MDLWSLWGVRCWAKSIGGGVRFEHKQEDDRVVSAIRGPSVLV